MATMSVLSIAVLMSVVAFDVCRGNEWTKISGKKLVITANTVSSSNPATLEQCQMLTLLKYKKAVFSHTTDINAIPNCIMGDAGAAMEDSAVWVLYGKDLQVSCPAESLANGDVSYSDASRKPASSATYTCKPGYILLQNSKTASSINRTCESGKWSDSAPTCNLACPAEPVPPTSRIDAGYSGIPKSECTSAGNCWSTDCGGQECPFCYVPPIVVQANNLLCFHQAPDMRTDAGYPGISKEECVGKGKCWAPNCLQCAWCYEPPTPVLG